MIRPIEPLAKETIIEIHRRKIEHFGGLDGVRDEGLLEAALAQPWQSFGGNDLYPTVEEKAARLAYEIISQHPFADGNKRTGAAVIGVILRTHGFRFKPRTEDFYATVYGIADGSLGYDDLVAFVRDNCATG